MLKHVIGALVLLATSTASADTGCRKCLSEIYNAGGLAAHLQSIPHSIASGFNESEKQLGNDDLQQAIVEQIHQAFDPVLFKTAIVYNWHDDLVSGDAEAVLQWLESDLGRKITQAEVAATAADTQYQLEHFADTTTQNRKRQLLISALDQAMMISESSMQMAINAQAALAYAVYAAQADDPQYAFEDFKALVAAQRNEILPALRSQNLLRLTYTYQTLQHHEIEQYIAFILSPAGSSYQLAMQQGIADAFVVSSLKLGDELSELLRQHQPVIAAPDAI